MKLHIRFFSGNLQTATAHLLVSLKQLKTHWMLLAQWQAMAVWSHVLHTQPAKSLEMSKLQYSLTSITLLILCLCMVSVWIAPMFLGTGTPVIEFTETDSDPSEFEEDLFLVNQGAGGILHPLNLRIGAIHLNMQPASLARVFSPPKPFSS
jgi:hypothetical protein